MIKEQLEKGSEFTYGVHGQSLAGIMRDNQASIMGPEEARIVLEKLDSMVMGSVRKLNEVFELLRQGIAYSLPFKFDDEGNLLFLVYRRNKRNNVGQLSQKLSLAPGGHIENDDLSFHVLAPKGEMPVSTPAIDFRETLEANLKREVMEEVRFDSQRLDQTHRDPALMAIAGAIPVGFVMDSKPEPGYVGNIHFGVLFALPVASDATFDMREEHNDAIGWISPKALAAHSEANSITDEYAPFEPWSQMIIDQIDQLEHLLRIVFNRQPVAA